MDVLADGRGRWIFSASDVAAFTGCRHRTWLDQAAALGLAERPATQTAELRLLAEAGEAHEQRYLAQLRERGRDVVTLGVPDETPAGLRAAHQKTLAALRAGREVLYQPTLLVGRWMGRPDFLIREPGTAGDSIPRYQVVDAKLARRARPEALVQTLLYDSLVRQVHHGSAPEVLLILGDGEELRFPAAAGSAYVEWVQSRLVAEAAEWPRASRPEPVPACATCPWHPRCEAEWRDRDDLSLVAGMRSDQVRKLRAAGVDSLAALARWPEDRPVRGIGVEPLQWLRTQAELQRQERASGEPVYVLRPPAPGQGLARLPAPAAGDMFFDLEGDPLNPAGSLEYLWGWVDVEDSGPPVYRCLWAHAPDEERRAFEQFVDHVVERRRRYPDMHVYHYAAYEPTVLKRLMGRYGTREREVDRLLRGGVLVDLFPVVRQAVQISRESYSIKELEAFYRPGHRGGEVVNAMGSVVAYARWKVARDPVWLEDIRRYNEEDCRSTWELRGWLEDRRADVVAAQGIDLPRPVVLDGSPSEPVAAADETRETLRRALLDPLPDDAGARTGAQDAQALLAELLLFHRREDRPMWWRYFQFQEYSPEELVEDPETLGQLTFRGEADGAWVFDFDPDQEYKMHAGQDVSDPDTGKTVGRIRTLDPVEGRLTLRPRRGAADPPRALMPAPGPSTAVLEEALQRVARSVLAAGELTATEPFSAAKSLLLRENRDVSGEGPDEAGRRARDRAGRLRSGYLAVQGPPGTGKTYTGAQIVVDLLERGRRVGLTAPSHNVIAHLLEAVLTEAESRGVAVAAAQKVTNVAQGVQDARVRVRTGTADMAQLWAQDAVNLAAATVWLFARPEWEARLDVLVVDEAGQMTLANLLAAATSTRAVVLLGDPQQLSQPIQGQHPPGSAVSALEHVLAGQPTIAAGAGVFLDVTRRLHPDVCRYISEVAYEGRLRAHPACARQRLDGDDALAGTGLRYCPVSHRGNRTVSVEEVDVVRRLITRLVGRRWHGQDGTERPLALTDILVVAPYNAHVNRLVRALPVGSRVGTVDRFQGQEAPVVIYTLASSTPDDVPRGLAFLYSLNRLNVAVSRAQGLAVLVASPSLLAAEPKDAEQLSLVNALCRLALDARSVEADI